MNKVLTPNKVEIYSFDKNYHKWKSEYIRNEETWEWEFYFKDWTKESWNDSFGSYVDLTKNIVSGVDIQCSDIW